MVIQSGTFNIHDNLALREGDGTRNARLPVSFPNPFIGSTPTVAVSLTGFDASNQERVRVWVNAE